MIPKEYVDVTAEFTADGQVIPRSLRREDGTRYQIDRILDIRPAAALKAGGYGIRYTCRIRGQQAYLFREEERWFIEPKP